MKTVLSQLAIILGGGVAVLSLVGNLLRHMDLLTAVFRASLVFVATVTVILIFLKIFSNVLVRFVAEQVIQQKNPAAENKNAAHTAPTSGRRAGSSTGSVKP